ncbi:MAG: GWxTD domain-containing protein, partial [Calditrichia bacterium]
YTIRNTAGAVTHFNQYPLVNTGKENENYIRINRQQFSQSRYRLEVTGTYKNKKIKNSKMFSFFWTTNPESPRDLDKALRQMDYMMEADSIRWALKQPYAEKLAYFERFWERMDPNPETRKNELMDEYYRRVNYANQVFSTLNRQGWETDMGRIFIKFGEPDDVERHPFEIDTMPYEIWRYYDVRKEFLFVDQSGFGDYYLHPNYINEEYE